MMRDIKKEIRNRVLLLDGAMGTMIQQMRLTEEDFRGNGYAQLPGQQLGNNDLLTLTRPDVIQDIHRRYLDAGADIIETNTFNAQRISMADYYCEPLCYEMNLQAARLARGIADEYTALNPMKPRFVAGSIGPTNKTCSIGPDINDPAARAVTFDELAAAYREQIEALIEGGVDLLLMETIFDTLNVKAALYAAGQVMAGRCELPIMLSATIADKSGRTLAGQTVDAFLASISSYPVFSVGLNCSFGASEMLPFLEHLSRETSCYVSAYPNAGLPNDLGSYDQTPENMAQAMEPFVTRKLVNIVGGCCGTTDAYIREVAHMVRSITETEGYTPRVPQTSKQILRLSGLDALDVVPERNFVNIGERCNVAGSRRFLRCIRERNYAEAVAIARKQVEDGAQIIDINMDDGLLDAKAEMVHFLNLLAAEPEVARVPFMIDSSNWDVISAALKCVQGKCIVNSISLKEGEETFLTHAKELRRLGAATVVMAFDEQGQADTFERKIEVCQRAYRLLTEKAGFPPQDIIFDPNILAICTGIPEHNAYALDFLRATTWIKANLPGAHVSGGVSNLSFSFRGNNYLREAMHAVFLYHAVKSGMDMGIVNPSSSVTYTDLPKQLLNALDDVLLNRRDATEELLEMAHTLAPKAGKSTQSLPGSCQPLPTAAERLHHALLTGNDETLTDDLNEALTHFPHAIQIIEGPLMGAMNRVGELFGDGKMFLPQVVKAARTMKKAVGYLEPYLLQEKGQQKKAGKALLATVKGDVHDIGKNIVSVVLSCNNFEIVDLGIMCPAEDIRAAALREKPDFIGLSGLITPSLNEMIQTVNVLDEAGISVPVLIGGAATSPLHTALKIAPAYSGPVIWVKDASQMVLVSAHLTQERGRGDYLRQVAAEQDRLRQAHAAHEAELLTLDEARNRKLNLF